MHCSVVQTAIDISSLMRALIEFAIVIFSVLRFYQKVRIVNLSRSLSVALQYVDSH